MSRRPVRLASPVALVVALLLSGCGKKGPPLPPLGHRPEPPSGATLRLIGDQVVLGFQLPARYSDGRPLEEGASIIVLRSEAGGRPREFRRLGPQQVASPPGGPVLLRLPQEELFQDLAGERVILQVAVQGERGRRSDPSPPLSLTRAEAPAAPFDLSLRELEDGLRLRWAPPAEGLQYNVYRRTAGAELWGAPRNGMPMDGTEFFDREVAFGSTYEYQVRSLAPGSRPLRESRPAGTGPVDRMDRFPPGPPTSVRAVAGPEGIRIFWFPPPDADLAGFRLYRAPLEEGGWELWAELPVRPPSHLDRRVAPGAAYRYAVSGVDGASPPNEGPRSETATERAAAADEGGGW